MLSSLYSPVTQCTAVDLSWHACRQELQASRINIDGLKRLTFHGVPDQDNLRATVWKVCVFLSDNVGLHIFLI